MKTRKNTAKGALLSSIVALLLCFAMLFGTTFAWFTDIVESNDATLIAGVLDIEMTHTSKSVTAEKDVTEAGVKLFEDVTLWEPGAVTWENFHIYNKGDLALKYMFSANFTDENYVDVSGTQKGLSDILKIAFIDGGIDMATATRESVLAQAQGKGTLLKSTQFNGSMEVTNDPKTIGVIIYWEPGAQDNDFNLQNGKTTVDGAKALKIDLGMTVVATQLDYENDSFDNQYDVNAAYPVVLPDNTDFTQNTGVAVDGQGNYYATLTDAIKSGASTLYLNPGVDLGTITHLDVADDLTIYGNNAYISSGERDFAIDTYAKLTKDITVNIYNLDGVAIWGQRNTEYTVNINLYGCEDISRVYLNGTSGVNNINLQNCTANKDTLVGDTAVYSNANGIITVNNCTFTNVGCPVNLNHKIAGEQTVNVTNTTFFDCATEGTAAYYAPIRLYNSVVGANQTLTATGNTFTYSAGKSAINGADVLLNVLHSGNEASGTINASVQYDAVVKSGLNVNL